MYDICLKNDAGKCWTRFPDGGAVKGFVYASQAGVLEGAALYERLQRCDDREALCEFLHAADGNFSAVVRSGGRLVLVADRMRTYPLLYAVRDGAVTVTDVGMPESFRTGPAGCATVKNSPPPRGLDEDAAYELLAAGYLSGDATLLAGVKSVAAGTCVVLEHGEAAAFTYAEYASACKLTDFDAVKRRAAEVLEEGFGRMLGTIAGRPVLLPLSSGYDSRLIACLCRKFGLRDVVCFTYGRRDSFEVEVSRQVAERLGYEWHYVEYTSETWRRFLESPAFDDYCAFSGNLTANPHFQDFPAVMELRRQGVLREGMVVLPGHVGDMGGCWLPRTLFDDPAARWDGAAASRLVYDAFYDQNVPTASRRARLLERLERSFRGREYPSADALLDDYITWVFRVRGANFLVNAVRVYEYWGLDWRLPLCEMHYKLLWYSVPWETKIGSKLYDEFLFQYYFEPFDVPFRKPVQIGRASCRERV